MSNDLRKQDRSLTRAMVLALSSKSVENPTDAKLDTTGWSFGSSQFGNDSPSTAREQLHALLEKHGHTLLEVFKSIDTSDDCEITYAEFMSGMRGMLGFTGPERILDQIWASVDDDNSGAVDFEEINLWFHGRSLGQKARENAARHMTLAPRVLEIQTPWDVDTLRAELRGLVEGAGIEAIDLLKVWAGVDSVMSKGEWLKQWKKLCGVGHSLQWYDMVRDAVTEAFELMDRDHGGDVTIEELAKFLHSHQSSAAFVHSNALRTAKVGVRKQVTSSGPAPWVPCGVGEAWSQTPAICAPSLPRAPRSAPATPRPVSPRLRVPLDRHAVPTESNMNWSPRGLPTESSATPRVVLQSPRGGTPVLTVPADAPRVLSQIASSFRPPFGES